MDCCAVSEGEEEDQHFRVIEVVSSSSPSTSLDAQLLSSLLGLAVETILWPRV